MGEVLVTAPHVSAAGPSLFPFSAPSLIFILSLFPARLETKSTLAQCRCLVFFSHEGVYFNYDFFFSCSVWITDELFSAFNRLHSEKSQCCLCFSRRGVLTEMTLNGTKNKSSWGDLFTPRGDKGLVLLKHIKAFVSLCCGTRLLQVQGTLLLRSQILFFQLFFWLISFSPDIKTVE